MAVVVDSSVLIALERGTVTPDAFERCLGGEPFVISAVTLSELLHGVYRAKTATQRKKRETYIAALLEGIPILPFDEDVARVHAMLWADLAKGGSIVGERDLLIAATAVHANYPVATSDTRSFARVPGLTVLMVA